MTSRREFLAEVGALALLGPRPGRPDLVLYNGQIITIDEARPRARAIAIAGDRFVAVGDDAEIRALARRGTRMLDLGRRTVVPGFIDAHTHPAVAGRMHLRQVDCDLRSIAAIQSAIRERASRTPPGQWVLGFKYDDTKTAEGRFLTSEDLDAAAPNHPVHVQHRGGHTAYVNSLAFAKAGVSDQTADPVGGKFARDSSGRLTGRVLESADAAFDRVIPQTFTRDDYREGVKLMSRMLARSGVTSAHDAYGDPDDLRGYQDALAAGELVTRIYCLIVHSSIDKMIYAGVLTGFCKVWVLLGAIMSNCDCSI